MQDHPDAALGILGGCGQDHRDRMARSPSSDLTKTVTAGVASPGGGRNKLKTVYSRTQSKAEKEQKFAQAAMRNSVTVAGGEEGLNMESFKAAGFGNEEKFKTYDRNGDGVVTMEEYVQQVVTERKLSSTCACVCSIINICVLIVFFHLFCLFFVAQRWDDQALDHTLAGICITIGAIANLYFFLYWPNHGQRIIGIFMTLFMCLIELIVYIAVEDQDDWEVKMGAGLVCAVAFFTTCCTNCYSYWYAMHPKFGNNAIIVLTREEAAAQLGTGTLLFTSNPGCFPALPAYGMNTNFGHMAILLRDPPEELVYKARLMIYSKAPTGDGSDDCYGAYEPHIDPADRDNAQHTNGIDAFGPDGEEGSRGYFSQVSIAGLWDAYFSKWHVGSKKQARSTAWVFESTFAGIRLTPFNWWLEAYCPSGVQLDQGLNAYGKPYRHTWKSASYFNTCYARELYVKGGINDQAMRKVWKFVKEYAGMKFPNNAQTIQCNALFRLNDRKEKPESFFCSELVATTLQMMGVFEDGLDMANITPSDFAMANRITDVHRCWRPCRDSPFLPRPFYLPLQNHAHYGPLISVDFNLGAAASAPQSFSHRFELDEHGVQTRRIEDPGFAEVAGVTPEIYDKYVNLYDGDTPQTVVEVVEDSAEDGDDAGVTAE